MLKDSGFKKHYCESLKLSNVNKIKNIWAV